MRECGSTDHSRVAKEIVSVADVTRLQPLESFHVQLPLRAQADNRSSCDIQLQCIYTMVNFGSYYSTNDKPC